VLSALVGGHRVTIGHATRGKTAQGSVTLTIKVNAAGRHARRARLTVTAKPVVGATATARRSVALRR
jgi:hypothetical protein